MMHMWLKRNIAGIIIGVIFFLMVGTLFQPQLFIGANQKIYQTFPGEAGTRFSLSFIHSVQLTPVVENFVIEDSYRITLDSTEYQSLGVGLPFLKEDGVFHTEQNKFIVSEMNRSHRQLNLRTGPEAKLSLTYAGQTIPLYSIFPPGTLVQIWVGPMYSRWM